jgi:hypothetical protein
MKVEGEIIAAAEEAPPRPAERLLAAFTEIFCDLPRERLAFAELQLRVRAIRERLAQVYGAEQVFVSARHRGPDRGRIIIVFRPGMAGPKPTPEWLLAMIPAYLLDGRPDLISVEYGT